MQNVNNLNFQESRQRTHTRLRVDRCSRGTVRMEWWVKNRMMDEKISHEACGISPTSSDLEMGRNRVSGRGWWQKKSLVCQVGGSGRGNFTPPSAFSHKAHAKMPNLKTCIILRFDDTSASCSSKWSCCSMGKACSLFFFAHELVILSDWYVVQFVRLMLCNRLASQSRVYLCPVPWLQFKHI